MGDDAGQDGKVSYRVITDRKAFDAAFRASGYFGAGPVPATVHLPNKTFDEQLVASVMTRGQALVTYTVDGVTLDPDGTATVRYTTKTSEEGGASYACPLIVCVPQAGVKKVAFVANGKAVGTAEVK